MIQSLEKALVLLNAVATHGSWIGVRELSRATGIKPPTAQQLLKTLQAFNYLEFDTDSRRYRVGIAALMLGHGIDSTDRLGEFSCPHIDRLFEETGETTVALACERGAYFCVYGRHCEKALATSMPSSHDLANPHIMAAGQSLLAWQGDAAIDAYIRSHGINGGTAGLLERLAKIRVDGYAELIDFNKSSVVAYGVPVFDVSGMVALSIGWSVPLARFDASLRDRIVPRLLALSRAMGLALGFKRNMNGKEAENGEEEVS